MSCQVHTQTPAARPVAVSVNGVAIARQAIAREVQHFPAANPVAAWKQAARALVIRELLNQEAGRLGLTPEPMTDEAERRETAEEALIRALIDHDVKTPEPDADACRRYYDQNPQRFRSPDVHEASHILFAARADDTESYEQARREAEIVLGELRQHPDRFADLARMHSACPSGSQGGNLGQLTKGQTSPEFERALVALAPGALCTAPVATRYGFHIIWLERRHEGRILPYELVAERIAEYLKARVERRAVGQYIARLAGRAQITGIELADGDAHRVY